MPKFWKHLIHDLEYKVADISYVVEQKDEEKIGQSETKCSRFPWFPPLERRLCTTGPRKWHFVTTLMRGLGT